MEIMRVSQEVSSDVREILQKAKDYTRQSKAANTTRSYRADWADAGDETGAGMVGGEKSPFAKGGESRIACRRWVSHSLKATPSSVQLISLVSSSRWEGLKPRLARKLQRPKLSRSTLVRTDST